MHGGAGDFHTPLQNLLMNLQTIIPHSAKGRNQCGMNIDNPIGKPCNHLLRYFHQKTCQHNKIRIQFAHFLRKSTIKGISVPIILRAHQNTLNPMFFRTIQRLGAGVVTDYRNDLRVCNPAVIDGIQNRLEVCSSPRYTYYRS